MSNGITEIDLKKIRALLAATRAGWEGIDGDVAYDSWIEKFGDDQVPRLIESLELMVQLAQCVAGERDSLDKYYRITNR